MKRRTFIQRSAVTASLVALAGCSGDSEEDSASGDSGSNDDSGGDGGSGSNDDDGGSDKKLEILEHEAYQEDYSSGVRGKVKNVSGEEQSYVAVEAKFFDENGERLGDGLDNVQDLGDGKTWQFECVFLDGDEFAEYEIKASTSPF